MTGALVDPLDSVRAYLAAASAANTRKAYASDFGHFADWCACHTHTPLPAAPLVVAQYLAQLADAGLKASTIVRRAAAIRAAHKAAGHEPPTNSEGVRATLRGIRRTRGVRPERKKPATASALSRMIEAQPATLAGLRNRALLLLGFAAALRRSEIVDLKVNDLERRPRGLIVTIRRSKTDQEGRGQTIAVPNGAKLKPVDAVEAWLAAAHIAEGPLFRSVDRHGHVGTDVLSTWAVARIVKRAAAAAGLDPALFSGHSLRAGFVTSALADGVDPLKIMQVTRHVDPKMLAVYDRRERDFDGHAGGGFL